MNKSTTIKLIAIQALITSATSIFAHDGHELQGSHWHASDTFGFVILAAAIGLTLWFGRGGE
jgi:predicted alpha/beta hydrolase